MPIESRESFDTKEAIIRLQEKLIPFVNGLEEKDLKEAMIVKLVYIDPIVYLKNILLFQENVTYFLKRLKKVLVDPKAYEEVTAIIDEIGGILIENAQKNTANVEVVPNEMQILQNNLKEKITELIDPANKNDRFAKKLTNISDLRLDTTTRDPILLKQIAIAAMMLMDAKTNEDVKKDLYDAISAVKNQFSYILGHSVTEALKEIDLKILLPFPADIHELTDSDRDLSREEILTKFSSKVMSIYHWFVNGVQVNGNSDAIRTWNEVKDNLYETDVENILLTDGGNFNELDELLMQYFQATISLPLTYEQQRELFAYYQKFRDYTRLFDTTRQKNIQEKKNAPIKEIKVTTQHQRIFKLQSELKKIKQEQVYATTASMYTTYCAYQQQLDQEIQNLLVSSSTTSSAVKELYKNNSKLTASPSLTDENKDTQKSNNKGTTLDRLQNTLMAQLHYLINNGDSRVQEACLSFFWICYLDFNQVSTDIDALNTAYTHIQSTKNQVNNNLPLQAHQIKVTSDLLTLVLDELRVLGASPSVNPKEQVQEIFRQDSFVNTGLEAHLRGADIDDKDIDLVVSHLRRFRVEEQLELLPDGVEKSRIINEQLMSFLRILSILKKHPIISYSKDKSLLLYAVNALKEESNLLLRYIEHYIVDLQPLINTTSLSLIRTMGEFGYLSPVVFDISYASVHKSVMDDSILNASENYQQQFFYHLVSNLARLGIHDELLIIKMSAHIKDVAQLWEQGMILEVFESLLVYANNPQVLEAVEVLIHSLSEKSLKEISTQKICGYLELLAQKKGKSDSLVRRLLMALTTQAPKNKGETLLKVDLLSNQQYEKLLSSLALLQYKLSVEELDVLLDTFRMKLNVHEAKEQTLRPIYFSNSCLSLSLLCKGDPATRVALEEFFPFIMDYLNDQLDIFSIVDISKTFGAIANVKYYDQEMIDLLLRYLDQKKEYIKTDKTWMNLAKNLKSLGIEKSKFDKFF